MWGVCSDKLSSGPGCSIMSVTYQDCMYVLSCYFAGCDFKAWIFIRCLELPSPVFFTLVLFNKGFLWFILMQLIYTKDVDSSVHKQTQFENTFYTSLLRANSNIGSPNLQQSELVGCWCSSLLNFATFVHLNLGLTKWFNTPLSRC